MNRHGKNKMINGTKANKMDDTYSEDAVSELKSFIKDNPLANYKQKQQKILDIKNRGRYVDPEDNKAMYELIGNPDQFDASSIINQLKG